MINQDVKSHEFINNNEKNAATDNFILDDGEQLENNTSPHIDNESSNKENAFPNKDKTTLSKKITPLNTTTIENAQKRFELTNHLKQDKEAHEQASEMIADIPVVFISEPSSEINNDHQTKNTRTTVYGSSQKSSTQGKKTV